MKKSIFIFLLIFIISCQNKTSPKKNNEFNKLKKEFLFIGLPKSFSDTLMIVSNHPSLFSLKESDSLVLKIDYKQKQDSLYQVIEEELDWCETDTMWVNPARDFMIKQQKLYDDEIKLINQSYYCIGGEEFARFAEKTDPNYEIRIKQMILRRQYEQLLLFNYTIRLYITRSLEEGNNYSKRIPKRMGPYTGIHLQDYKNVKKLSNR